MPVNLRQDESPHCSAFTIIYENLETWNSISNSSRLERGSTEFLMLQIVTPPLNG